jgi:plastocyanin
MPTVRRNHLMPARFAFALMLAAAVASSLVLAASPTRAAQHAVQISNFAFSPPTLTIAVGDTVTWTNGDEAAHTATSMEGAFDSGNLDSGQAFSFTFTEPGAYAYRCDYHSGMQGTIVVEAASAPAPTPPPSEASGGAAPGATGSPATGSPPNTALEAPAAFAWLAPLLIGLGLVSLAFGLIPPAREAVRAGRSTEDDGRR